MNNQENQENDGEEGRFPMIESAEDYIRRYGLPHANDEQAGGEFNGLTRTEATERVRAEEEYRDEVIKRHQAPLHEHDNDATRLDEKSEGGVISVLLADTIHPMPVQPLVSFCETVKRMVASRLRYGNRYGVGADDSSKDATETTTPNKISQDTVEEENGSIMELSLVGFDAEAALQFMDVLISLQDHQKDCLDESSASSATSSRKRRMNDDAEKISNNHIMNLLNEGKISEQHIVECVKISHFLQCKSLLEALTSILELSIDAYNCMAICSLADALNLKSLFESSVNFVIDRLDAFQGTTSPTDNNNEGGAETRRTSSSLSSCSDDGGEELEAMKEIWSSLPYELQSRVLTMRNVMRSSVIGRGSKVSGLFFSSGNEFLAIFRETIRDQKERLAEANERREEVIRERTEEWVIRCQRRGQWFDSSAEAKKSFVHGADVAYALGKIEKQSRRLATLESFYEEQKTIFKGGGFASEIRL
ncbi:hypothetical protein ACHAXR_009819 [Thalassiosira sp. AJA248-18]